MSFERINGAAMEYEAAVPAIQTVNATIDGAAANHAAIDMERDALVARALEADAKDAPKLAKAAEALRVKRLSVLLAEVAVPRLKQAAEAAVRAAAAAEEVKHKDFLTVIEGDLNEAAEALGYPDGSRQRTQMIVSDPNRRDLLRLKNQAHTTALNFRAMAPEDFAHAAALRQAIADMLR